MNAANDEDSIASCISSLKAGDQRAASSLWNRYFDQLVRLARGRLRDASRAARDEENIALSAFYSLCRGAVSGRFPRLAGRDGLWRLLVTIVSQKALDERRHQRGAKRGGGRTIGTVDLLHNPVDDQAVVRVEDRESEPELAAESQDEYRRLLERLGDDDLRRIAVLKTEGYENEEIARRLCCGLRTVERKLKKNRTVWNVQSRR